MPRFSKQELTHAFEGFEEDARRACATGDWVAWAEHFTEDAVYIEHFYGRMEGREAIAKWISSTMGSFPGNAMTDFPSEWFVVDEERGWVIFEVWNVMADPGDGSVHRASNITILHYAGDGKWSYEEDVYNPAEFATMLEGWTRRRDELTAQAT